MSKIESYAEHEARLARETADLYNHYDVTLTPLAPIDRGDWCVFCHKMEATTENKDTGDRYCDAHCALEHETSKAEAANERAVSRFYGG